MTLEKIQKLCDRATPGPWALGPPGYRLDFSIVNDADIQFVTASRTLLPKLLAVAKAAKRLSDNIAEFDAPTDSCFLENLDDALAALEAP